MKTLILCILASGTLILVGSQAKAHDGCYDYGDRYGYREVIRYERPRYYYRERPVVVYRRVVVDDDCYRRHYYHRSHEGFRLFFGF